MRKPNTANWIRTGLLALPLYGLLTFWATLDPQPDQSTNYEAWARFVSTTHYMLTHLLGSGFGTIFAIFGVFALGAYLATSRAGRIGLVAMVVTAMGYALFLMIIGDSAFGASASGRAYLAGIEEVQQVQHGVAHALTFLLAILLGFVGNVLLGVAVWRSGRLPKWAGATWVASALVLYPLGLVIGLTVTGNSPPTEPVGGLLVALSGGWMALSAMRQPFGKAAGAEAQPSMN